MIGDTACGDSTWVSQTSVTCVAPAGEGVNLSVELNVAGQKTDEDEYRGKVKYSFEGLTIDGVSPAHVATDGGKDITLHAATFGAPPSDGNPIVASVGAVQCNVTTWLNAQSIRCRVPAGVGGDLDVSVEHGDGLWRGYGLFSYDAPVVAAVSPSTGPLFGGVAVTISGRDFGPTDTDPAAYIGPASCDKTYYQSPSELICVLPPAGSANPVVSVVVKGQRSLTDDISFRYSPPQVTRVWPQVGPVAGHTLITIEGTGFGHTPSEPVAFVGNTQCARTQWISSATVQCFTPKAGDLYVAHPVTIRVLNYTSLATPSANFSYAEDRSWAPGVDNNNPFPGQSTNMQRHGTVYLTIACVPPPSLSAPSPCLSYIIAGAFVVMSLLCGRCLFSAESPTSSHHAVGAGVGGRMRAGVTRAVARVKTAVFKTSGVYGGRDAWDYNLVESIEMEANSEMELEEP